jgi:hypothetical protein
VRDASEFRKFLDYSDNANFVRYGALERECPRRYSSSAQKTGGARGAWVWSYIVALFLTASQPKAGYSHQPHGQQDNRRWLGHSAAQLER